MLKIMIRFYTNLRLLSFEPIEKSFYSKLKHRSSLAGQRRPVCFLALKAQVADIIFDRSIVVSSAVNMQVGIHGDS